MRLGYVPKSNIAKSVKTGEKFYLADGSVIELRRLVHNKKRKFDFEGLRKIIEND